MKKPAGIRFRAAVAASIAVATAGVIGSIALILLLQQELLDSVDTRARTRVQDVATVAQHNNLPMTLGGDEKNAVAVQALSNGQIVAQSAGISPAQLIADFPPPDSGIAIRTIDHPPIIGGGARYRVAVTKVPTRNGGVVVYGAASLEPVAQTVHDLKVSLAIAVAVLTLLVGAITWKVVSRTLRPVERIRREVAEISPELNRRVPEPATGDEIARLAHTMNGMLERIEESAIRQREFVSDAAHELRSPVAVLQTELEVATTYPSTEDPAALLRRLQLTVDRLARLVGDLLLLATAEERHSRIDVVVDLDELVLRVLSARRDEGNVTVKATHVDATRVRGDPEQLERVVINLLENALRHAKDVVTIEVYVKDRTAYLVVTDDGPGISEQDRERVFDRFVRLDEHRNRAIGGSGLGLAIVRRIVQNHNGEIRVEDGDPGARMVVRMPGG